MQSVGVGVKMGLLIMHELPAEPVSLRGWV